MATEHEQILGVPTPQDSTDLKILARSMKLGLYFKFVSVRRTPGFSGYYYIPWPSRYVTWSSNRIPPFLVRCAVYCGSSACTLLFLEQVQMLDPERCTQQTRTSSCEGTQVEEYPRYGLRPEVSKRTERCRNHGLQAQGLYDVV